MTKRQPDDPLKGSDGFTPMLAQRSRKRRESFRALSLQERRGEAPRNDLTPQLKLETRAISALKPAKRRVRTADPVQIARILKSIETYGICHPVLITSQGEIVDGHLVVDAAAKAGLTAIACIVIDHLSEVDIRRLRISLNRLAETGAWDFAALRIEIQELALHFDELEIPGIDSAELDVMLFDGEVTSRSAAVDAVPNVQNRAITQRGNIWLLDKHRLGCGDARDQAFIDTLLAGARVRLCLTDPPYGVKIVGHVTKGAHREFVDGGGDMMKEELHLLFCDSLRVIYEVLLDGGLCFSFMDWRGIQSLLRAGQEVGFDLLNLVVWAKTNAGLGSLYRSNHELLPIFKKGNAPHVNNIELGRKGRWRSNLWTYPGASSLGSEAREGLRVHPTVKPVAMLEDAILDVTKRGDLIFDPFAGSGSTLIAAERAGRVCRGNELDPLYVDVILRRWIELAGNQPMLEQTGESFEQVSMREVQRHRERVEIAQCKPRQI